MHKMAQLWYNFHLKVQYQYFGLSLTLEIVKNLMVSDVLKWPLIIQAETENHGKNVLTNFHSVPVLCVFPFPCNF